MMKKNYLYNLIINVKITEVVIVSILLSSLMLFLYPVKDYYKYYKTGKPICRIDNVINIQNGKVCYGVSDSFKSTDNWMGNHIWQMKNGVRVDKTCPDCKIIKTNGCLIIKNNSVQLSFDSLSNFWISVYYKNLFFYKNLVE